ATTPMAEGEVSIVYFPGRERWLGIAVDDSGVQARVLDRLPGGGAPVVLEATLLRPFARALEKARRVHILAHGAVDAMDVHAVPFRGRPLAAQVDVDYPAGLWVRPNAATEGGLRRALVVADPDGDLPHARAEADAVVGALRARGVENVTVLAQHTATRAALLSALPGLDLFHFSGHADVAGPDGWESALALATTDRLTAADVLALPRAPAVVVLSACEGARARYDAMGLAHAFVASGAAAVIAPTRPVSDTFARAVSDALYAAWTRDIVQPAAALRLALAGLTKRANPDWATYRVVVP
ncbi:MAG TPA: CHAT domain-containing protein, partial [Labilithrix sp.]|nr:CHAT domain-containing protein [Labilithrix sp.]